jgi:hypothetical protein
MGVANEIDMRMGKGKCIPKGKKGEDVKSGMVK